MCVREPAYRMLRLCEGELWDKLEVRKVGRNRTKVITLNYGGGSLWEKN